MTAIRITSLCSAAYRHWQSGIARIRTPLLLSAGHAAIDRYFLSASNPAAVGLLLWAHAGTDRRTDTVPLHRPWYAYYAGSANKQQWQFMEPGGVLHPIRVHRIGSVTVKLWCTNCCINEHTAVYWLVSCWQTCWNVTKKTRYRPGNGETICLPAVSSSTVAKIAADLRPSTDGSAVRTSMVAGGG